jgi:hypothetical protein
MLVETQCWSSSILQAHAGIATLAVAYHGRECTRADCANRIDHNCIRSQSIYCHKVLNTIASADSVLHFLLANPCTSCIIKSSFL